MELPYCSKSLLRCRYAVAMMLWVLSECCYSVSRVVCVVAKVLLCGCQSVVGIVRELLCNCYGVVGGGEDAGMQLLGSCLAYHRVCIILLSTRQKL